MKVPNCDNALVPHEKIANYLLNPHHPDGASKARFFIQSGFDVETLSLMLIEHVVENNVFETETTTFGVKYAVEGMVESPLKIQFKMRSVWIILNAKTNPTLITAYPLKK